MKYRKIVSVICLLLTLTVSNKAVVQDLSWLTDLKKIKLLTSQKSDVEKLFAKRSQKRSQDSDPYRMKQGRLYVHIADGICRTGDWNAPAGAILSMSFFLEDSSKITFNDFIKYFNINLDEYAVQSKEEQYNLGEIVYYEAQDGSLQFAIVNNIYLHSVIIDVPDNYDYPVCK